MLNPQRYFFNSLLGVLVLVMQAIDMWGLTLTKDSSFTIETPSFHDYMNQIFGLFSVKCGHLLIFFHFFVHRLYIPSVLAMN